jgi:hypothetical protein
MSRNDSNEFAGNPAHSTTSADGATGVSKRLGTVDCSTVVKAIERALLALDSGDPGGARWRLKRLLHRVKG